MRKQYKERFVEDDLLINNQQTSSNRVQGGEVGDTVKKNETHKSSFSSPADFKMTEKTLSEKIYNLEGKYYTWKKYIEAKDIADAVRRLKEEIDRFIFPKCDKCGACFCIHIKKRFKKEIINSIFGSELAGEEE